MSEIKTKEWEVYFKDQLIEWKVGKEAKRKGRKDKEDIKTKKLE